jgi:hypothetical protein
LFFCGGGIGLPSELGVFASHVSQAGFLRSLLTGDGGVKVTVPCELRAIEILARMTGYNEPEKIEVKTDGKLEHVVDAAMLEALT